MNILQDAARVVGHVDVEALLHVRVPLLRDGRDVQFSREQSALDVISQEHVEGIRELVRLDPNQARLHAVDGAVEVLGGRFLRVREKFVKQRRCVPPERFGLQDHAFPQ